MQIRSIESRLNKLMETKRKFDLSHYESYRGEDSLLNIKLSDGKIIKMPPFENRPYQIAIGKKTFIEDYQYVYMWWPRRHGKEVKTWEMIYTEALRNPGLYLMVYPTNVRARLILWEGAIVLPDGRSMRFVDMIPSQFVVKKKDDSMTIILSNKSVIRVMGSDIDPEKLRGSNPRMVVLSEYAFSDPRIRLTIMPILRQNGGKLIIQTTPNGVNHAFDLMKEVQDNPEWHTEIQTVETLVDENGHPYVTPEMLASERASGMPEWLIRQEYYCDVKSNSELFYFSKEMAYVEDSLSMRLQPNAVIPNKPCYAAFDIGWNDSCAVTVFQSNGQYQPHIIGYIENNNKPLQWYAGEINRMVSPLNIACMKYFFPHDGENKNFSTGKNTREMAEEAGMRAVCVKRPASHAAAIQMMRALLPFTTFSDEPTRRLRQCLNNYQKEFDDKRGIYKKEPMHNWASHGVKSYQTLVMAFDELLINERSMAVVHYNDMRQI